MSNLKLEAPELYSETYYAPDHAAHPPTMPPPLTQLHPPLQVPAPDKGISSFMSGQPSQPLSCPSSANGRVMQSEPISSENVITICQIIEIFLTLMVAPE